MVDLITLENLGSLLMLCFLQAVLGLITFFIFPSKANADFIATVEESLQIADEGKANASQQAADLQKLETELYNARLSQSAVAKSFHEFAEAGKDH